jgi:hypothetical protein
MMIQPQGENRLIDADTVANRARLAEECAVLGKWQEAWEQYDVARCVLCPRGEPRSSGSTSTRR